MKFLIVIPCLLFLVNQVSASDSHNLWLQFEPVPEAVHENVQKQIKGIYIIGDSPTWVSRGRAGWTAVYYHRADSTGIGFDRTSAGSDAVSQYFKPVADKFANLETCPDEYLLWFHHLPWSYKMRSGKPLWDELCCHYCEGVEGVIQMQKEWDSLQGKIDPEEFEQVKKKMGEQLKLAEWWRNSCVLYFQQFSRMPIPAGLEKPEESMEYYQKIRPGNFLELINLNN